MKIYIASDHGGFELKNKIVEFLTSPSSATLIKLSELESVQDLGPTQLDPNDDFTDYSAAVGLKIQEDKNALGILICRSGIGVCIAANKFKGVYAALCFSPEHAAKAREHDNANVLCLDADYSDKGSQIKTVESFLSTKFSSEERYVRRFLELKGIEEKNMK